MSIQGFLRLGLVATLAMPALSHASGFLCQNAAGDLRIETRDHVHRERGTRNVALMILSDPTLKAGGRGQSGNRTIAKFDSEKDRVRSRGSLYEAEVDLRRSNQRKGEYVGGTRLQYVDRFELEVNFKYSRPLDDGQITNGEFRIIKRDGRIITHAVKCERKLKH